VMKETNSVRWKDPGIQFFNVGDPKDERWHMFDGREHLGSIFRRSKEYGQFGWIVKHSTVILTIEHLEKLIEFMKGLPEEIVLEDPNTVEIKKHAEV
jgi:hypothetical protein